MENNSLLPGIAITERPAGLEYLQTSRGVWISMILRMKELEATECVAISLIGVTEKRLKAIKTSLGIAAKKVEPPVRVRFAVKGQTCYAWVDK